MKKIYTKSIFIFHRDLRLHDNTALREALKTSEVVIPCFIFDEAQISEKNKFRSLNALQFMIESLIDLRTQLQEKNGELYLFYGKTSEIVENIIEKENIDAIFSNKDYTPFAQKRDADLNKICKKNGLPFFSMPDALLHEPEEILKKDSKPYIIFTPFFKAASQLSVKEPSKNTYTNYFTGKINNSNASLLKKLMPKINSSLFVHGGRLEAEKIMSHIKKYSHYDREKDFPALCATTKLSAHNKFGTYSIREIFYALKKILGPHHSLLRQLYWRDFFTHIAYHFPHVFGHAFHEKFDSLEWENNNKKFEAWCTGTTGFPIVDAGMRELNTTGFMHNRVRMVVASFLVKDLHIDWRWGERYFASQLIDYDPAVNNGNWQWSASTGCDAQPYFRIFNPWLQQKKFDPECDYIKTWVPELKNIHAKKIHTWDKVCTTEKATYPRPIVDHAQASKEALNLFKNLRK